MQLQAGKLTISSVIFLISVCYFKRLDIFVSKWFFNKVQIIVFSFVNGKFR